MIAHGILSLSVWVLGYNDSQFNKLLFGFFSIFHQTFIKLLRLVCRIFNNPDVCKQGYQPFILLTIIYNCALA